MDDIVFDGKWTTTVEWKPTSLDNISGQPIYIRSAHMEDYVYIMIDYTNDRSIEKMSDRSIICFDTLNDKTSKPNKDDYCFQATLGSSNAITMQGGTDVAVTGHFKKISNHKDLIAIGNVSDENDRHQRQIPHPSYEFRIPTDVIGRSDNYGFLVYVYDGNNNSVITWPANVELNERKNIPSPSQWGDLISPDKSLPEFHILFLILASSLFMLILSTKMRIFKILRFN
ncbi:hypothetical protein [Candidatus Nitrosopumilus sediminis]|nr:hypothetical protein [Candidatus Nitrosopumilus sediminis]